MRENGLKMGQNGSMTKNGSKMGQKWVKMGQNGSKCGKMWENG
jgi:hypothetical protein